VSGQPVSACRRYREVGKVVSVDQSGIRYPVVVRFDKVGSAAGMHAGRQQHRCSELPNCPAHLLRCSINHLSTLLTRRSTTRVRIGCGWICSCGSSPVKDWGRGVRLRLCKGSGAASGYMGWVVVLILACNPSCLPMP
jgi:hypothetical protein